MPSRPSIPACVAGLGRIGSLLEDDTLREKPCTHAGAIASDPHLALRAGCDPNPQRRTLFARRWRVPVYADAAEMLRVHRPLVLHIAAPPGAHRSLCALAAGAGVSVIVCEKPLADSLSDARAIAALHRRGPCRVITNHERRYAEDYLRAKAVLDKGTLGEVLSIRGTLYMGQRRVLGRLLWHDGTHMADAIRFLGGGVLRHERAWGARLSAQEGTAFLAGALDRGSGRTKKRIPVLIEVGAGRDHLVFEIAFSCEWGALRIGNGVFSVMKSADAPYAEGFRALADTGERFTGPARAFANLASDAAACARDPTRVPASTALDGLAAVTYLRSVYPLREGLF
ncbi:MAG: Gfo/Idh/MocA family oxidoreductase [Treponema sp.]|jgi:predicted dehydrogenase|nr:Gfo/Idh/MocA family oxidoreductase [Treponema sp.]